MLAQTEEIIETYRKSLRQTSGGEKLVATASAEQFKSKGFDEGQAFELMAAEGFDLRSAKAAIDHAYGTVGVTEVRKERLAMLVPTSYKDVQPLVEDALRRLSAREFVDKLTRSAEPIVRTSSKRVDSWYRLVAAAKQDGHSLAELHRELKPWFEQVMYDSVLLSEKDQARVTAEASSDKRFVVSAKREEATVDLENGLSSGKRFASGHFADFGLADEYLVRAADIVSPHQRLKRALKTV